VTSPAKAGPPARTGDGRDGAASPVVVAAAVAEGAVGAEALVTLPTVVARARVTLGRAVGAASSARLSEGWSSVIARQAYSGAVPRCAVAVSCAGRSSPATVTDAIRLVERHGSPWSPSVRRTTGWGVVRAALAGVALGAVVAACGDSGPTAPPSMAIVSATATPTPTPSPSPSPTPLPTATPLPTPTPTATPSPTPAPVAAPLTGALVPPSVARRHPMAVMIDDIRVARPQSGLHLADVVWHAPAEGGIPRYMAIFQSRLPTSIGPVRSARSYYVAWASEWKALYAHSGGSPQALATLRAKGNGQWVYDANEYRYGGRYYHRTKDRFAPHNVYTDGKTLRKLAKARGAKDKDYAPVWTFGPDAPLAERPYGGSLKVRYPGNTITYRYSRTTNTWKRSVTGEGKQFDAADDERIEPQNVVVMWVDFRALGDRKHRLEADLVGRGKASVFTNGRRVDGTWRKAGTTKPTLFYDKAGDPIPLTIGQTFIQVIPRTYGITVVPGSDTPPPSPTPSSSATPAG